jgi:iron donor protein CyaY
MPHRAERRRLPARHPPLLARIEATTDRWLQDDVIDIDSQRTGGLLELSFPDGSKIILNTQPPLHEVWLAARGGGYHYRWVDGRGATRATAANSSPRCPARQRARQG